MKNNYLQNKAQKYTFLLIGVFLCLNVWGQEIERISEDTVFVKSFYKPEVAKRVVGYKMNSHPTLNTLMISAGSSNMYDTYLSPLEYKGYSIRLMYEMMRKTSWFDNKFYKQQLIELEFSSGDNPAKNVKEYWGRLKYQLGGHYAFYDRDGLRLSAGGFWDINVGGLYNERNGNNPATARAYTNLNLSLMASYKWKKYALRWQIDTPFMGMLFSPKYGQSYYEISLGNTVGLINFSSFHNQRSLRNLLTVDIPINKFLLRVGYLGDWYQTKVHCVQTHHYTHSFVIGFPFEGAKTSKGKNKIKNSYWD